ncbi:unnamed protein product [Cyclocybe aegerita]|uniref:Cytochrome P450 n=1 Tax=Cyclocybe aegerita TaxID=1973307 RepID=A0A8S0W9K4_CYCAE|nr:unnamed protein product [Cyclocybe aegerita]
MKIGYKLQAPQYSSLNCICFEDAADLGLSPLCCACGLNQLRVFSTERASTPWPISLAAYWKQSGLVVQAPLEGLCSLGTGIPSDILSLQIPGATVVILNKEHAVQDLFVKRGLIYSDRPYTAFFEKLGISRIFVFQDYGARWKNNRKTFKQYLGTETESLLRSNELLSSRRLLVSLLESNDHQMEFRQAVNDFFLSATYGIPPSQQNEHVALTQESAVLLKRLMIQGLVFDFSPFLTSLPAWFTAVGVTRGVGVVGELVDKMMRTPFESAKADSIQGMHRVLIAGRFFRLDEELSNVTNDEETSMIDVLGTSYAAGTDTVVALINSFALAMVLYPDVQQKAYEILNSTLR